MKTSSRRTKASDDSTIVKQTHGMVIFLVVLAIISIGIAVWQVIRFVVIL